MGSIRIRTQVEVVKATQDTSIAQWGQVKELVNKFNKETVRVATVGELTGTYSTGVLTLDTPVAEIDGITLVENDRILVKDQLDATVNGIYVIDDTGSVLTRSDDFLENSILMNNTRVAVAEGTINADTVWNVVSDGVLTVGTSSILFTKDAGDSGVKRATGVMTGDDTAKEFVIPHNFNLTNPYAYSIIVKTRDGHLIFVDDKPTLGSEANSITVSFDVAPESTDVFDVYLESLE